MFAKFNLAVESEELSEFYEIGQANFKKYSRKMEENLKKFVLNEHSLDGKAIQDSWFSTNEKFDIFLSHSHKDKTKIISIAGFLQEKLGLNSFIDSCLWGCSDDLLRMIDDTYCINPDESTYSYEKRNYTTSHVHMMLSIALMHMIDKCEAFFLISTSNSICLSEGLENRWTISPWIYHELSAASMLRCKRPERWHRKLIAQESVRQLPRFGYPVEEELRSFYDLSIQELIGYSKTGGHVLDYIYKIKGIKML